MILLQVDFPLTGPWGPEMGEAFGDLARDIADEPGLIWKIWTEAPDDGRAGGIYLFASRAQAEDYRDRHSARLAGFGLTDIRALLSEVNKPLSAITRAPLG